MIPVSGCRHRRRFVDFGRIRGLPNAPRPLNPPHRTRIKICGITTPEAGGVAATCGADAIGFIFYDPSPRHLELDQAAAIRAVLPPMVASVAVMVNPEPDYVRSIIERVGVTTLQFHGEEDDAFCAGFGLPYLKGIRVSRDTDPASRERDFPRCQGILLDTWVADQYGGSGRQFDWDKACYGAEKPLILAGGLDVDNVAEAVRRVRPYAVDVSSSLETDGVKDPVKVAGFCREVMAANLH